MGQKIADVCRTSDYTAFHYLNGNRDVDQKRVQNVIDSIKNVGYVMSPLVVNEKMEVIDGQARLKALEMLKMPVDYVVAEGAGINECIYLNMKSSAWRIIDYIKTYSKLGNKSYSFLWKLCEDYSKLGMPTIINALSGSQANGGTKDIKAGGFQCTEEQYINAKKILDYEMELLPYIRKIGGNISFYMMAIRFAYEHSHMDMEVLKNKIMDFVLEMSPTTKVAYALDELEMVYNRRSRSKVYGLKAEYFKVMNDRYAWYQNKYQTERKIEQQKIEA